MQNNLEREQDNLKRRHTEILNNLQREFESEKNLRQQRFEIQVSKYTKSGQNYEEMNGDEEKKEIAVILKKVLSRLDFTNFINIKFSLKP